jgi:ABC-type multidrug transport system ATPase subunit
MMRTGRLLAMDTPLELKKQFVPGDVYEVYATPLLAGLSILESSPLVQRAGLAGDHLRVIVNNRIDQDGLKRTLVEGGVQVQAIHAGEASLEDVFIRLAKEKQE